MSRCEEEIIEAVKDGYLSTDAEFLKEDSNGGTGSVTALIRNGNLVVSNAGDCRAVLSRGGVAEVLTDDHRPSRKDERDRIENQGGYVDCCNGIWRIQGSLAVSRAFADRHLKQWVVAEPETTIQEAVDVVRPSSIGVDKSESISACKRLVDLSVMRGSIDDISAMNVPVRMYFLSTNTWQGDADVSAEVPRVLVVTSRLSRMYFLSTNTWQGDADVSADVPRVLVVTSRLSRQGRDCLRRYRNPR
ncbi:hypothetical protein HYC85_013332 [Camellia sinensis]|uniref:PPM-type phosphatase domain-containing protein n=1 Tax=Camellia sinensis TaxID=4442 RepID=A0A7J7H4F7_CAMSI|nr:hypothetical protein HYC85_013332 [Camellia sinensis]